MTFDPNIPVERLLASHCSVPAAVTFDLTFALPRVLDEVEFLAQVLQDFYLLLQFLQQISQIKVLVLVLSVQSRIGSV